MPSTTVNGHSKLTISVTAGVIAWYLLAAVYLFVYSHSPKAFVEEILIRDSIALDAWSISFFLVAVALWRMKISRRVKATAFLAAFGIYGFIMVAVIFNGTPFGLKAFWGDQQFRLAMILTYTTQWLPRDFFYKDLPPFYPPLYYLLLSLYARVFSVESFKMIKVGSMAIYLIGPAVLYFLWRKLVTPLQALLVTMTTFLVHSWVSVGAFLAPHAFVASTAFVPWWLYYIEGARHRSKNWKFYLSGGIIGGCLFMTFFYPFFVGGFVLILRVTVLKGWSFIRKYGNFGLKPALAVLSISALVSAPYWLPLFISISRHGIDRSRGGWHDMGATGIQFLFMEFSFLGLLFLAALYFSIRRARAPVHRGLLLLIGCSVGYLLVGSVFGFFDMPINLVKSRQFAGSLVGPVLGLALASLIRVNLHKKWKQRVAPVLLSILLLIFLHGFKSAIGDESVKVARKATAPMYLIDSDLIDDITGRVILSGYHWLPCFYPAHTFIGGNEHYSHPASRYIRRYELLYLLHRLSDPYLFNLGLKHNVYDAVDYYLPRRKGSQLQTTTLLSNYPDRFTVKELMLDDTVVSDTALFEKLAGNDLYAVREVSNDSKSRIKDFSFSGREDSLLFLAGALCLENHLDKEGRILLHQYLQIDTTIWRRLSFDDHTFGDTLNMTDGYIVTAEDSTYFLLGFQPVYDVLDSVGISLCVSNKDGNETTLEIKPQVPTREWKKADMYFCLGGVSRTTSDVECSVSVIGSKGVVGRVLRGTYSVAEKVQP